MNFPTVDYAFDPHLCLVLYTLWIAFKALGMRYPLQKPHVSVSVSVCRYATLSNGWTVCRSASLFVLMVRFGNNFLVIFLDPSQSKMGKKDEKKMNKIFIYKQQYEQQQQQQKKNK